MEVVSGVSHLQLTCYNQEKFVREAVRGALAQDYHPLEVLIIDNDSTDNTLEILRQEIARYPVRTPFAC